MTVDPPKCWICGEDAATREHLAKASDLKSLFGTPTRTDPLYFHVDARPGAQPRRNVPVGSLKSRTLKFEHRICLKCNSARTQPHDRAWELCSAELRKDLGRLQQAGSFRANWLFPYDTRRGMLNMHLYFVKLFGCQLVEGGVPIDIAPFGQALLQETPHPNLYLSFGPSDMPVKLAGGSDMVVAYFDDGKPAFASWFYTVGDLSVNVMYAAKGEKRAGLDRAWHPRMGAKRLVFAPFSS